MVDVRELMQQYCDGDALAFRSLYAQVAPPLHAYLVRLGRDHALADDVLQQTFLKLHRARHAYIRGADPIPWLYAIAHRTFLDEVRRLRRGRPPDVADIRDPSLLPNPRLMRAAIEALAQLPAPQRDAVVLIKLEGMSFVEAAAVAGTTVG